MLFSTKYSEIDDTSVLTHAMHGRQAIIFQSPKKIIFFIYRRKLFIPCFFSFKFVCVFLCHNDKYVSYIFMFISNKYMSRVFIH